MLYAAVGCEEIPEDALRTKPFALQSGDAFLLCTDGFWENIEEEIMEEMLHHAKTPEQWIDDMMDVIPDPNAPGLDNFSALAVWVGDREATTTRILAESPQQE